jgi:hypothetical protein
MFIQKVSCQTQEPVFSIIDNTIAEKRILRHRLKTAHTDPSKAFSERAKIIWVKGYQVHSSQSIDRLLLLIILAYIYCAIGTAQYQRFNIGLKQIRKSVQRDMFEGICRKRHPY